MIKYLKKKVKKAPKTIYRGYLKLVAPRNPKIFCIGRNKTGTTSFKVAMEEMGFLLGNQKRAEKLSPYYHAGNFDPIIKYCHSARVFQDFPFSWPNTYKYLHEAFPDAKFILTVRSSGEEWYSSFIRFKIKRFGKLPDLEDLKNSNYVWKGWEYENTLSRRGGKIEGTLWDKDFYIKEYNDHNKNIKDFFKRSPEQLLVINIAEKDAYSRLCDFVGKEPKGKHFPWANKT